MSRLTIQQAFNQALQHHQAGRLQEAEQGYRQILAEQPGHADALHLLGLIARQVGRNDLAIGLIRQAIAFKPSYPEAQSNLGNALRDTGQLDEAIAAYRQAIALKANYPEAQYNLGVALSEKGQLDEAIAAFRQAIALRPAYAEAHSNLGGALIDKGQLKEGIAAYRQAIRLNPGFPAGFYNLGSALKSMGQPDEAIAAFRKAIALNPGFSEAHSNLGNVLKDKGQLDEAIAHYRQAIGLRPDLAEAHYNLGAALDERGRVDEAIIAYRQALALKPNLPEACNNLANAMRSRGQLAEAVAAYRQAIALNPGYSEAFGNLGLALRELGQFDEAAECLRRALAIKPDGRFYEGLVLTGRQVADAAEVAQLTRLVNQPGLAVEDRIAAEFALGKSLDEAGRFDDAFAHFAAANRSFKETRAAAGERFDADELRRVVDRTIQSFTPAFFTSRRGRGDASELPAFIVGMPRSGTSLVEQIAASHPAVFGAGELHDMPRLALSMDGAPGRASGPGSAGALPFAEDAEAIVKASRTYLGRLRSLGGAALRVTDKMPGNVFHLGLIALLFPGARVIFCRRDARDNCLSCYFEQFDKNRLLYTYDLLDCGRQYMETERLTAHWRQALPLRMLEVQYEMLVADQEPQSRRLIEFLGLPWDSACLEFHRTKRPVLTASAWQVRQPMYTRSAGRWRHYERHLGPLLRLLEGEGPCAAS